MRTLNSKSMNDLILAHLKDRGSITNVEAQALYRCRALPRRIADLKTKGHDIMSVLRQDKTGQRYARYVYVKEL